MRHLYCILALITICSLFYKPSYAQELPVQTQRLTNGFLYNPGLTGVNGGSLVATHQQQWLGGELQFAPETNYAGFQTPLAAGRLGVGVNFMSERISIFQNTHLSASTAWHAELNAGTILSFGLQGEYYRQELAWARIQAVSMQDPMLSNFDNSRKMDFSYGMNLKSKQFEIGGSLNRLFTWFTKDADERSLTSFFTLYSNYYLPVADERDMLEFRVSTRKVLNVPGMVDIGSVYTWNKWLFGGLMYRRNMISGYRTNSLLSMMAGLNLTDLLTLGVSRDIFLDQVSGELGPAFEIVVRANFAQRQSIGEVNTRTSMQQRNMAFQRKTMSMKSYPKKNGKKKPTKMQKRMKKFTGAGGRRPNLSKKWTKRAW